MENLNQNIDMNLNNEIIELEKQFEEVFLLGKKHFQYDGKTYFVKYPTATTEGLANAFKPFRLMFWTKHAMTKSKINEMCRNNPEDFPRQYLLIIPVDKMTEDGIPYVDYDERIANESEHSYLQKAIKEGISLRTIKEELGLDQEVEIKVMKGETELSMEQCSADSLADRDITLYKIMLCGCNEDGSPIWKDTKENGKIVKTAFDNFNEDVSGLKQLVFETYNIMMFLLDKKKFDL